MAEGQAIELVRKPLIYSHFPPLNDWDTVRYTVDSDRTPAWLRQR